MDIKQSAVHHVITQGRTLNYAAPVYDILSPLMTLGAERRVGKKALELLNLQENEKVLDIGCGTGTLTRHMASLLTGPDSCAVGIDAAEKMVQTARKKSRGIEHLRFDWAAAEDLPYEDASFDCAVSTFFFHHVNENLKRRCVGEMWRVLKHDGKAVVADVDIPGNFFGKICAWSGFILFHQQEIRENIKGVFKAVLQGSAFSEIHYIDQYSGYISLYCLRK